MTAPISRPLRSRIGAAESWMEISWLRRLMSSEGSMSSTVRPSRRQRRIGLSIGWRVASLRTWKTSVTGRPAASCSWNRLAGFGGDAADLLAGRFTPNYSLVDILPTDAGFSSKGCGTWTTDLSAITPTPTSDFRDGMYLVGVDVAAGIWQHAGAFSGTCIYQRLSGFTGTGVISIGVAFPSDPGPQVTIQPTDTGFSAEGCGTWIYQGQPPPVG